MATISVFPVEHRVTSPVEQAISDALTAMVYTIAKEMTGVYDLTDAAIAAVLRQPVSLAAAVDDICQWLGVEPPVVVEDALSS